jgi:hypothetical protein
MGFKFQWEEMFNPQIFMKENPHSTSKVLFKSSTDEVLLTLPTFVLTVFFTYP